MSLTILFHFLCAQHVSDINISIIRSLRLFLLNYDIGRVVLVRYVLASRYGRLGVVPVLHVSALSVSVLQASAWSGIRVPGFSLECIRAAGFSLEWYPCCRLQPGVVSVL